MSASCKVSGIAAVRSGPVSTCWPAFPGGAGTPATFRELFDIQWHPIRLGHDVLQHFGGQGFASYPLGNQRLDLPALQAIEHERGEVGAGRPGRAKRGARRQDMQHRHRGRLLDDEPEQLQRGGVGPVQVFPHRQHGLTFGLCCQPCDQHVQRLLFLVLGVPVSGAYRSSGSGTASNPANSGTASASGRLDGRSPASNLISRVAGASSRANCHTCSRWVITGWRALAV